MCVADRVGRKPVILLGSLVFTAGSVIMGLANGQEVLLVGRLVVGVGIGKFIYLTYRHYSSRL
jgi:SP family myo-inositol transporter-like MFS transporter 13